MAAAAVVALGSCSEGQYWTEPANKGQVIAFVKPAETITLAATENMDSFTVKVNRSQSSGDLDYPVKFTTNAAGVLNGPSSVIFKSGENVADYTISIGDLVPGTTYTATVELTEPEGSITHPDAQNLKYTFTISKTLTWTSIGTGSFLDAWVMDNAEAPYEVEIMKVEGVERYRVMNPYKEYYESPLASAGLGEWLVEGATGPEYVEFWENEDGKLSFNSYSTGLFYEGNPSQVIGAYSWSAFNASAGYTGDNDIWYEPGFAVLSPVYYINGLGGFGQMQYAVQIELP